MMLDDFINDRRLDGPLAESLRAIEMTDSAQLLPFLDALRPSANTLRELLRLARETALRDGLELRDVLFADGITAVSGDPALPAKEKQKRVRRELELRRYPEKSRLFKEAERLQKEIRSEFGFHAELPEELEGDSIELRFGVRSANEAGAAAERLKAFSESETCGRVFNLLLGRLILFGIISLVLLAGARNASALDEDFQGWAVLTANGPLTLDSSLRWYLEAQPRIGRDFEHIERLLLRPALSLALGDGWSAWAGYAWTPVFHTIFYANRFDQEHRIWTQLQHDDPRETVTNVLRLRFENRFIDRVENVANRFRILYRISSKDEVIAGQRLTAYDELFLNLNDTPGPRAGFDRNRIFLGPYWKVDVWRFELGYLNEFSIRRNLENRDIHAVVVFAGLTL